VHKKSVQQLSDFQRAELLAWLEASRPTLAENEATIHQAARAATVELEFAVSKKHVKWLIEEHGLDWKSWGRRKPKNAWRCPVCGQLMKRHECPACDLSRSQRENIETALTHGQKWFFNNFKKRGEKKDGKQKEQPE